MQALDYYAVAVFVIATCVTPGPNNVMLMSSGANFGMGRTLRHVAGINIGFPLMVVAVGLGAGAIFRQYPGLHDGLQVIGAVYLLFLAYQIARSPTTDLGDPSRQPLGFTGAALFQWVNPKAWVMAVGAVLAYTSPLGGYTLQVFLIALLFFLFGTPCSMVWVFFGQYLRRFLTRPRHLKVFNIAMSLVLVVSLIPVIKSLPFAQGWF
ncbi:LysE Family Transporter [Pseudomonas fluorescens]|jgi:threonine/homoserine/homoserine lactone efflux protein|uniref:LysE family translocator n=1 Tax=Pseudomonas fluorescens TaxID=294 RepID=UPI00099B6642|nr:LysE family translocator [Pseudomonas fluorescens]OPB04845.1 LysE Family Transporter [Pseudomonas fluorescens]